MAELTIDQALEQGIEAHKAGQVQEADRLYTAILKAQPKHPDANHNMGVLAVGVGTAEAYKILKDGHIALRKSTNGVAIAPNKPEHIVVLKCVKYKTQDGEKKIICVWRYF